MPQASDLGSLERLMARWDASIRTSFRESFDEDPTTSSSFHYPNRCPHCDSVMGFSCRDDLCQFSSTLLGSVVNSDNRFIVSDRNGNSRAVIGDIGSIPPRRISDIWGTYYSNRAVPTVGGTGFWSISNR